MKNLFTAMLDSLKQGEDLVLCSIIASSGSTPRGKGAKMAVFADGTALGTVGGGAVEYHSIELAKEAIKSKSTFTKGFNLAPNETADIGMVCGGQVVVYFQYFAGNDEAAIKLFDYIVKLFDRDRDSWLITHIYEGGIRQMCLYENGVGLLFSNGLNIDTILPLLKSNGILEKGEPSFYVEPLTQAGTVYVFGGGHVSQELVPVIEHVGFRPFVYEDRDSFANSALFPKAMDTIVAPFSEILQHLNITGKDYAVIMTRGHQSDYEVLEQVLRTPATYIGVIGSKHKIAATIKKLVEAGFTEEEFRKRVHTPIGLPIKGETPAEIAISIAGEMILHRAEQNEAKV